MNAQLDADVRDMIRGMFAIMGESQAAWQDHLGFSQEGHDLRDEVLRTRGLGKYDPNHEAAVSNLRNYYMAKMSLIMTEVSEATDEFRKHEFADRYYSKDDKNLDKPEGVLSELADVIIRIWSLTGEAGLSDSLAEAIIEKINYNWNRSFRNGGKTI